MANRRMFSKNIINSAKFIKMPPSSQVLYFHLAINADDDGVVEGYGIMRTLGSSEDDLKILVAKQFIIVLNEDLVTFIKDWQEHNLIRPDRRVDSIHRDLLLKVINDISLLEYSSKAHADIVPPNVRQMSAKCPHRLGKVRSGKVRSGKVSFIDEIIAFFNEKAKTNKYTTGSEREGVIKYINQMLKNGDTAEDIKLLIEYKLSNPNTQKIALESWINSKYSGVNMSSAKAWLDSGKKVITLYEENVKPSSINKKPRPNMPAFTNDYYDDVDF